MKLGLQFSEKIAVFKQVRCIREGWITLFIKLR